MDAGSHFFGLRYIVVTLVTLYEFNFAGFALSTSQHTTAFSRLLVVFVDLSRFVESLELKKLLAALMLVAREAFPFANA